MKVNFRNKTLIFLGTIVLLGLILFLPESAHATPLAAQIKEPPIVNTWKVVLSIVNIFAILALIMMALVNILRINIEAYNFRRLLPALILGIVLANFSHLICRFMVDFAQILTNFFIQDNTVFHGVIDGNSIVNAFGIKDAQTLAGPYITNGGQLTGIITGGFIVAALTGFLPIVLIAVIIVFLPSMIAMFLALLMYVRLYIIWFLVVMSPVAFFGLIFEPLKGIWSFWWGWFSKWLFLAPIGFFFLRLAVEVGSISANVNPAGSEPAINNIGKWIFGLGMVFLAAYIPFSWGQNVFGALKGAIMRGAALGYGGMKAMRRHEGFAWSNAGAALKKSGKGGWLGNRLGGIMENRGKGLMMNYGTAWEARKGAIDSKQEELALDSSIGKIIATPRQAAIERIKKIQQTYDNWPNESAWAENIKPKPDGTDSNIVAYLRKCQTQGEEIAPIDPSLTRNEQEGAHVYQKYFSQAIAKANGSMIKQAMKAYEQAEVNLTADNSFAKNISERIRSTGIYVENVPGSGRPQVSNPPPSGNSGGGGFGPMRSNTSSESSNTPGSSTTTPSSASPRQQSRGKPEQAKKEDKTATAMTSAAKDIKAAASAMKTGGGRMPQQQQAKTNTEQIAKEVSRANAAALNRFAKQQNRRPVKVVNPPAAPQTPTKAKPQATPQGEPISRREFLKRLGGRGRTQNQTPPEQQNPPGNQKK